jgi:UDP:flavonoid glycosyltransferase YjiC (YdhE family)
VRLDTYGHAPEQLTGALDRVLGDRALHERLARASERLHRRPGTAHAADLIERL